MKRRIAVIVLALVMCLFAVGCDEKPTPENPGKPEYKLEAVGAIECVKGETPDWSKGLKLTVNGEEVPIDNSEIKAEQIGGTELRPKYLITYVYNGVTLQVNVFVSVKNSGGEDPIIPVEDKTNMTPEQLADFRAALTKSYDSFDFVYTNADSNEIETIEERYQAIDDAQSDDIAYYECNRAVVIGEDRSDSTWFLRNYIDSEDDDMFAIYLDNREDGAQEADWIKRSVTSRYFADQAQVANSGFMTLYPHTFSVNEIAFDAEWFNIETDGSYKVRPFNVSRAFDALYEGIGSVLQIVPYSITLSVEQGNVKSIECEVALVGSGTSVETVIKFEWANFNGVTVTLPNGGNVPELEMPEPTDYIKPDGAEEIADTTALKSALETDYDKMTCVYKDDRGVITEQHCELEDFKLHYKAESYYFGTQSSNDGILQIEDDGETAKNKVTVSESEAYFNIDVTNGTTIYEPTGNLDDYRKYVSSELKSIDDLALYTPEDLPLDVAWFGLKDGKYVIKSECLQSATAALEDVLGFGKLYSCELVALTAEMNQSNQIVGFDMMLKYKETKNNLADYWRFTISYDKIGNTTVVLPAGGNTPLTAWESVDESAKTKFKNAVAANNFKNVTVTDTATAYVWQDIFTGAPTYYNTVTQFEMNKNRTVQKYVEEGFFGLPNEMQLDYEYRESDQKYVLTYYTMDNKYVERADDQATYDNSIPNFHFDLLTDGIMAKMEYDSVADAFILKNGVGFDLREDFIKEFIPYAYSGTMRYDAIAFSFDGGENLGTIKILTLETMQDSNTGARVDVTYTYSFKFSDYNSTTTEFDYEREAKSSKAFIEKLAADVEKGFTAANYAELKANIEYARKDYEEYTEKGKAIIDNIGKLATAEQKLQEFEAEIESAATSDKTNIDAVIGLIENLPTVNKDNFGDIAADITAARDAYNALKEASKLNVSNYKKLTDAEKAWAGFKYKALIDAVIEKIGKLTSEITEKNYAELKAATEVARAEYNALPSDEARANVTNYNTLTYTERMLEQYEAIHDSGDSQAQAA